MADSNTNVYGRQNTGFKVRDSLSQTTQDLGQRYVSKDYLLDVYPNIASSTGTRTAPGLWGWGINSNGGLGLGSTTGISTPVQVGRLTNWKQVSVSGIDDSSTYAITVDGALWAWGNNASGQLGTSNRTSRSSPVQVGTLTNWKQVCAGEGNGYAVAIKTDGTLWAWGNGSGGGLGDGTTVSKSSPIQIGSLSNWKQVSIHDLTTTTYAVKTDGTLWAWGTGAQGELGIGSTVPISSPVQIGTMTNWKQVFKGALAIKTDGTLWTWGRGGFGANGTGNTINYSSPVQVGSLTNWKSAERTFFGTTGGSTFAIKTDGTLWAWGANDSALDTNGTMGVLGLGDTFNRSSPVQVGSLTNWKQITICHTSPGTSEVNGTIVQAIKTDGTLWGWGFLPADADFGGSIGNGIGGITKSQIVGDSQAYVTYSSPIQIGSMTSWKSVVTSGYNTLAIQDGYI